MQFQLFPDTTALVAVMAVLVLAAVVTVVALGAGLARAVPVVAANRRVRLARHEGLLSYYGHAVLGH